MEHRFREPSYTIGIEEELMILDAETLELTNMIEAMLEASPSEELTGEVKPELMESVLEIATTPCRDTVEAGRQLRDLRARVCETARDKGLAIGAAGTHPFAMWEDQRIVARPRYRDLISALRFVARQEIIFGIHVHVGLDDPDKAIHVANGMRVHVPVLLALSANSPFWRADATGLASSRTPIFRAFPRVGIPPTYRDWADYERRIEFMYASGVIDDGGRAVPETAASFTPSFMGIRTSSIRTARRHEAARSPPRADAAARLIVAPAPARPAARSGTSALLRSRRGSAPDGSAPSAPRRHPSGGCARSAA